MQMMKNMGTFCKRKTCNHMECTDTHETVLHGFTWNIEDIRFAASSHHNIPRFFGKFMQNTTIYHSNGICAVTTQSNLLVMHRAKMSYACASHECH